MMRNDLPEPSPHGPRLPLRASDADRDAVVHVLRDATAHGMLTLDECDERMAAAYGARFRHELPPLTDDLPPVPAAAPVAPGWRAVAVLTLLQSRTSLTGVRAGTALRSRPALATALVLLAALPVMGILEVGELIGIQILDD